MSDQIVDTFGLLCPMPIIKTGEAFRKLENGATVEVIATDPGAISDLKDWCKANRHEYLGDSQDGRIYRIRIRKGLKIEA